ncbi:hypothetical protein EYF80_044391 [Liparis tanakae]|uniref:Uncharacterized protein n=1 Tax=Liparis tanakae TaxID=230148 RepID=A0A4Z2FXY9_9TELE|nr:hypothetical protein EYF80_044391 [Liparis tanakae]
MKEQPTAGNPDVREEKPIGPHAALHGSGMWSLYAAKSTNQGSVLEHLDQIAVKSPKGLLSPTRSMGATSYRPESYRGCFDQSCPHMETDGGVETLQAVP